MNADERLLQRLGYRQELARRMCGFSNFAISLSIICILAGGITSFQVGLCTVGGAAIGIGWPVGCLFSLAVAATMAQVASAFPTAGGLYHWASILGGRSCGWVTGWLNLAGLITVLAAVNAGTYDFFLAATGWASPVENAEWIRCGTIGVITLLQALVNHFGIRLTTRLTDMSGYLILVTAAVLTLALLFLAPSHDWSRLWSFSNQSGLPESGPIFPKQSNIAWLFALGLLLPAYTITGFDASAHTAEETVDAANNVPKGIVRSVVVSGLAGWIMISAILLAMPSIESGVAQGAAVVPWVIRSTVPAWLATVLLAGILSAQFFCGLAALTSASRMAYAFSRDGGLPASTLFASVSESRKSPAAAIWGVAVGSVLFTLVVPYVTIAAICTVLLYLSYVIPVAAGFWAEGRTWTQMGPWTLGRWFRPLAAIAMLGCLGLIFIGIQPPNERAIPILAVLAGVMVAAWFGFERRRFRGIAVSKL